jgi:hypothetical protein
MNRHALCFFTDWILPVIAVVCSIYALVTLR